MPDWKARVRSRLRLDGLSAARQEEIIEDLAGQLEDAWRDALARGLTSDQAEAFAWEQCPDWDQLSRDLRASTRGADRPLDRLHDRVESSPAGRPAPFFGLVADLLFALRILGKTPGITAAAILTLALGIGANTCIFSIIDSTLLAPLPFPDPDRLVVVWKTFDNGEINIVSAPNFWDWQRQSRSFEHLALFDSAGKGYNLGASADGRQAEQVSGVRVTSDFFKVLGVEPILGRTFLPEEDSPGRDKVVILGHGLWMRRYGGDRALVGNSIRLDGEQYLVVGIMPRGFEFQFMSDRRELWVPAGWTPGDYQRSSNSFVAIARLRAGVTVADARTEMGGLQRQLARQFEEDRDSGATVVSLGSFGIENAQRIGFTLLAAVAFVLLIGCVNVANLMLARGAERRKEFAIRRALGASPVRILRQLLAESVLLSTAGGMAGVALAFWASEAVTKVLPSDFSGLPMRPLDAVTLDLRVLAFAVVVSCASGVLFGIVPALGAARGDMRQPLSEGRESRSGARNRVRHALVTAEVTLALIVLVSAGLMVKSMGRLLAVETGLDTKNVVLMELSLPQENLYYGPPGNPRFCDDLTQRVGSIPGVQAVGAAAHLPLRGNAGRAFSIEGRPEPADGDGPSAAYTVACPGYFRAMGVPVLRGREFSAEDRLGGTGAVVINQALADRYWPNEDPIGRRIAIGRSQDARQWLVVVGVVGNVRHWGLSARVRPQLFRPYTQAGWPVMTVVVKTATAPASYVPAIRTELARVEPDRPPTAPILMEEVVRRSVGSRRFPMLALAAFGTLALLLAAVGILGVVSHAVTQRTQEVAIRVALGAPRRSVLWLMVGSSMRWVMAGVALGSVGSFAAARLLAGLLYEVKPGDPWVLASVAALLTTVALAASYVPARRATRVDPLAALRSE